MIGNITFGQYFPADSPIHKLDPRLKLVLALAMIIVVFLIREYTGYLVFALFLVLAVGLSKVKLLYVLKGVKPLWMLIIFTFILNVFFYGGPTELFRWGFVYIAKEAVIQAAIVAVRLILLIEVTTILMLTTSPMEITYALELLMNPLKKIKFPAHEIAMMMSIALRFIPTLIEETDKIMKAQTARGASFDSGNIFKRAAGLVPLLVPLFISAFKRAEELALAMESRCYHGGENRTRMKTLKMGKNDTTAFLVTAIFTVAMFIKIV